MPQIRELNEKFFDEWSSEMAYVLGFIFADGSIFKNKRGGEYLDITSTDLGLLGKIRTVLRSNHKIGTYKTNSEKLKRGYKIQIGNKHLITQLKKLGVTPKKSLTMKFPTIPKTFVGDFIRGYFDGDGGVNLGRYWRKDRSKWKTQFDSRFTSGSLEFLATLHKILGEYTKGGFIYKKPTSNSFELVFAGHDSLNLFKLMYGEASPSLFLERKHAIFLRAFNELDYKMRV